MSAPPPSRCLSSRQEHPAQHSCITVNKKVLFFYSGKKLFFYSNIPTMCKGWTQRQTADSQTHSWHPSNWARITFLVLWFIKFETICYCTFFRLLILADHRKKNNKWEERGNRATKHKNMTLKEKLQHQVNEINVLSQSVCTSQSTCVVCVNNTHTHTPKQICIAAGCHNSSL